MFHLSIFNLKGFFQTVDRCTGAVYLVCPDGSKKDINKQFDLKQSLQRQFFENKRYLRLCLDVPGVSDYLSVVCFSLGDY